VLDEYLALGGVELGNNARAKAYASCLPCCAGLLKGGVCTALHDATTGYTDAVREWQTTFTNMYPYPSFEAALGTSEVRRNECTNPMPASIGGGTPNGWAGATALIAAPWDASRTAARVTANGASTPYIFSASSNRAFAVGDIITIRAKVRASKGFTFRPHIRTGNYYFPQSVIVSNADAPTWREVVLTFTTDRAIAAADGLDVSIVSTAGAGVVGEFLDMGDVLIEKVENVARQDPYFDGGMSPDADLTASWLSGANVSASILSGVRPIVGTNGTIVAVRSGQWSETGVYSLRLIPRYATAGSGYFDVFSVGALERGKTYTAIALVRKTVASPNNRGGLLYVGQEGGSSAQMYAPNAAGEHEVRITFTVGATGYGYLRVYHGGAAGEPDIWFDDLAVIEGNYTGPYFDGRSTPPSLDPSTWRTVWAGTEDESASALQENVILTPAESDEPPYSCGDLSFAPWYDQSNPFSQQFGGFYLLSVKGITDGTMTAGVTESVGYGGVIGSPHYATRSVRVRTMLIGCGRAATHYGLAWLKAALGESFCSRHGNACGTSDLAFFIDCPPALEPGETDYAAATAPYRRYLHDVACTSSPIIAEEYETVSGAYVVVVEYILTAESPFVWGQTFEAESTGAVLTAYDDIPFNLMRRPSGEEGDGVPAVVATQYAYNGSAEYGGSASALPTGWARTAANISAGLTDAKSSDIAAVGPNSARVRLLATGTVTDGSIRLYYDVPLGTVPAGSAPSISIWAAALVFAGTPTTDPISAEVEWRTASATVSTAPLGQIPVNGGNISAPGLTKPPTATVARIAVTLPNIDAVSGDDIRLYADAFGLTVP